MSSDAGEKMETAQQVGEKHAANYFGTGWYCIL